MRHPAARIPPAPGAAHIDDRAAGLQSRIAPERGPEKWRCASPSIEPDIPQNAGAMLRLGACLGVARRHHRALRLRARRPPPEARRHGLPRAGATGRATLVGRLPRGARPGAACPADDSGAISPIIASPSAPTTRCCWAANGGRAGRRCTQPPMRGSGCRCVPGARSLNVALAAAIVLGEALRQTGLVAGRRKDMTENLAASAAAEGARRSAGSTNCATASAPRSRRSRTNTPPRIPARRAGPVRAHAVAARRAAAAAPWR